MSNEARHNHVSIDLKEMRESGIELKEESIIHQEQLDKVCEIIRRRLDDGKDYDPDEKFMSINDVISIFARRGAGKTTFVKTLIDLAKNNKLANRETNAIKSNELLCIDVIEPNQIYRKENFMLRFLASIQEKFDSEVEYYEKEKSRLRTLKEELYEALPVINGIGKLSLYTDWDDSDYVADKYIKFATKAKDLEQRFHRYIHKMMELSGRKALLFVLDDSDVNIERTFDILETIRLFFTSPQIIVIMTGDLSLYSMAIRRRYWEFFDKEYIEKDSPSVLSFDDKKKEYFDKVRQLEAQYLQKLVKAEHRIVLNTVYDKYNISRDEKKDSKYFIDIILSNSQEPIELRNLYRKILQDVRVIEEDASIDDSRIFVNHLLKQPFRNQYRLLSAYDEYLSTHKTIGKGSSLGTADLAEGVLKVFEVYINQSSSDGRKLMDRSPIYSGWLMKFLIDNNIATTASHLLPTIDDDTLNNSLFALCVWFESQVQIDKSLVFDYLIRVSFIRQALLILGERGKDLCDFVDPCRDIDVHKILGGVHAYFNAKIKQNKQNINNRSKRYPLAGVFMLKSPVLDIRNGIEENLIRLIQLECVSMESSTYICSFYKLITSLAELIRENVFRKTDLDKKDGHNQSNQLIEEEYNWIKIKLNEISQFHSYLEPNVKNSQKQENVTLNYVKVEKDSQEALYEDNFVRELSKWFIDIEKASISPQSLDRIFTRTYFTINRIDTKANNLPMIGEKFSNYVLAFLNACIVEEYIMKESIVEDKSKVINQGYEEDISRIFIMNYRTFKHLFSNRENSFADIMIACPLLKAYVNPLILTIIENEEITLKDYDNVKEMREDKSLEKIINEITERMKTLRDSIDVCQKSLLLWKRVYDLTQRIDALQLKMQNSPYMKVNYEKWSGELSSLNKERLDIILRQPLTEEEMRSIENGLEREYRRLYSQKNKYDRNRKEKINKSALKNDDSTKESSVIKIEEVVKERKELSVYNRLSIWDLY